MATQRYISTSFWTDKWIRKLDPSERYLYMYLLTNPQTNIAGVYQITIDRIAFDTGYDERTLKPMLDRFGESGKAYFYDDEWLILPSWPKHQRWETKDKIQKGIEAIIKQVPENVKKYMVSIGYQYPMKDYGYEPNYSDTDTDTDTDTDVDKKPNPKKNTYSMPDGQSVPINLTTHQSLVDEYGIDVIEGYYERISDWSASTNKKYADYSAACRNWIKDDIKKGKGPTKKHVVKRCPSCDAIWTNSGCQTCFLTPEEINDKDAIAKRQADHKERTTW